MRVLVTGATGFVGAHLVRVLSRRAHEVHAVVRPTSAPERVAALAPAVVHVHPGGADALVDVVAAADPEVVVHLAARIVREHRTADVGPLIDDNVRFGAELLEAMSRHGVDALIHTGTFLQHGADGRDGPRCLYGATKLAFDALLDFYSRARPLRAIGLTLYHTYGSSDPGGRLMSILVQTAREGGTLALSPGEQRIDLVHTDDVCGAYLCAIDRVIQLAPGVTEEFVVRSGAPISIRELVGVFESLLGRPLDVRWGARSYLASEVMEPWTGGVALPGWHPTLRLEDGIRRLLAEGA